MPLFLKGPSAEALVLILAVKIFLHMKLWNKGVCISIQFPDVSSPPAGGKGRADTGTGLRRVDLPHPEPSYPGTEWVLAGGVGQQNAEGVEELAMIIMKGSWGDPTLAFWVSCGPFPKAVSTTGISHCLRNPSLNHLNIKNKGGWAWEQEWNERGNRSKALRSKLPFECLCVPGALWEAQGDSDWRGGEGCGGYWVVQEGRCKRPWQLLQAGGGWGSGLCQFGTLGNTLCSSRQ